MGLKNWMFMGRPNGVNLLNEGNVDVRNERMETKQWLGAGGQTRGKKLKRKTDELYEKPEKKWPNMMREMMLTIVVSSSSGGSSSGGGSGV